MTAPGATQPRPGGRTRDGWLFVAPGGGDPGAVPGAAVLMALWVSVSDWTGRAARSVGGRRFVGRTTTPSVLAGGGLARARLRHRLRNNLYYVLLVVPLQTVLALAWP